MPKQSKSPRKSLIPSFGKIAGRGAASLEATREMLLQRLEHLGPEAKRSPGYKSALTLLNRKFRLATLSARIGILQAASFMIDVLERTPPFT
jgi:hypothetical protein